MTNPDQNPVTLEANPALPPQLSQDELDFRLLNTVLLHCMTLINEAHGEPAGHDPNASPMQMARRRVREILGSLDGILTRPDDEQLHFPHPPEYLCVHNYPPGVAKVICYSRFQTAGYCTCGDCYGNSAKLNLCLTYATSRGMGHPPDHGDHGEGGGHGEGAGGG